MVSFVIYSGMENVLSKINKTEFTYRGPYRAYHVQMQSDISFINRPSQKQYTQCSVQLQQQISIYFQMVA